MIFPSLSRPKRKRQAYELRAVLAETANIKRAPAPSRARLSPPSLWTQINRDLYRSAMKRIVDVVSGILLLIVFSPVIALAWLAVRLTSSGAGFFSQVRMGRDCSTFYIYKLRSMYVDQERFIDIFKIRESEALGKTFKSDRDPRVTPVGRFLRKTSIDELPQLWNVIRGDMSLVGPRPLSPQLLAPYSDLAVKRSLVRPGITGLWQVSARVLNTSVEYMSEYDLGYVEEHSLTNDLAIILKTPQVVLSMVGAQ
jgi:lipopolysaccharide/colanic/teichoic acid biosynthesis glycosyltransferase